MFENSIPEKDKFNDWWMEKKKLGDNIRNTCLKYGSAVDFPLAMSELLYDQKHKLSFCLNAKVSLFLYIKYGLFKTIFRLAPPPSWNIFRKWFPEMNFLLKEEIWLKPIYPCTKMVPVSGSGSHIIVNNNEQILVNSKCSPFCYGALDIWLKKMKKIINLELNLWSKSQFPCI